MSITALSKTLFDQIWPVRVRVVLAIIAASAALVVLIVMLRAPRSDRFWADEFAYTTTAAFRADGTASIRNVRDFTYGNGTLLSMNWLAEIAVDPKNIVRVWFVLEPFAKWKAIGHTLLTFELADGSAYSFSVEARREKSETYSALRGFFSEYELAYKWGTERDFITRRLLYLKHPMRMYPLTVDQESARRLFLGLLEKTNDIAARPRFYNTVTANCTNVLAHIVNQIKPGAIPLDISWYLPGYSDRFLMKIGLIATVRSVEHTQQQYDLTRERNQIIAIAASPHAQFGPAIRRLLAGGD